MSFVHVAPWVWEGEPKWIALQTPFVRNFIHEMKATYLGWQRRWNPELRLWMIHRAIESPFRGFLEDFWGKTALCDDCWAGKPCNAWQSYDNEAKRLGQGGLYTGRSERPKDTAPRPAPPRRYSKEITDAAAILGCSPEAAVDDIRAAFKKAALSAHPDQGGSHELFLAVRSAAELLLKVRGGRL